MTASRFAAFGLLATAIVTMICFVSRLLYLRKIRIDGWSDQIMFYDQLHEQAIILLGGSVGLVLLTAIFVYVSVYGSWDRLRVWILTGAVLITLLTIWWIMPLHVFLRDVTGFAGHLRLRELLLRVAAPLSLLGFSVLLAMSICIEMFRLHPIKPGR
jgi:hypothetical protein